MKKNDNDLDSRDNHITPQLIFRTNPNHLPCAYCGSTERKLGVGKAPGQSSLLCECGKFIKWISSASEVKAIAAQLINGGREQ